MSRDEARQSETRGMADDRLNPEDSPTEDVTISDHLRPRDAAESNVLGTIRAGETGSGEDADDTEWTIEVGSDVIGTCGHKVGEVVAVRDDHIVCEKGFFMPTDVYIPKSAILKNDEHGLYLKVTKNQALHKGCEVDPTTSPTS